MSSLLPETVERLIHELSRLPTIGRKSAQRLAFHLLRAPADHAQALAEALEKLHRTVKLCEQCFFLTETQRCAICEDPTRDATLLCVVEEPTDVLAFEKAGVYKGLYHVLHGKLSPLHGIMPENLRIKELTERLERANPPVRELILALSPTVDGDATALYVANAVSGKVAKITRLGVGLSIGSSLEYADELTLQRALESRRTFE